MPMSRYNTNQRFLTVAPEGEASMMRAQGEGLEWLCGEDAFELSL